MQKYQGAHEKVAMGSWKKCQKCQLLPHYSEDLEFEFITTQRLSNSLLYVCIHPKVIDMEREKCDSYLRMKQSIDADITKMLHLFK